MKVQRLYQTASIDVAPLRAEEMEPPKPGVGELLIRVEACGICHTDLHIAEGELPQHRTPLVPGHQIVGTVQALGASAQRFPLKSRVGVAWLYRSCGRCRDCRSGRENLCSSALFTGYDVDGGYAEYAIVPEAFAHAIPERFEPAEAAPLLCAGIIGYRALRRAEVQRGERVALFGFGASAHLALQVARSWECEVDVFTRTPAHRELALSLGARQAISALEARPESVDRAILFAPAGNLIPPALRALRRGGTLAVASIFLDRVPELNYRDLLYGERTLRSVTAATREDAAEFLQAAASIPIRTQVEVFPLEEANWALRLLKNSGIRGAGVLSLA